MRALYIQTGAALDYTPTEAVANGTVVSLGTRIGVVSGDIPANGTGTLHVEGVFALGKAEGESFEMGAAVYYDQAVDAMTATAESNVPAGYAVAPAAENDATVLVKLLG